jgi:hypothetical protein
MIQPARQRSAAGDRPETLLALVGKWLAIGILLTSLVMLLFPELHHRSGNASPGMQDAPAAPGQASDRLVPEFLGRSDK